jgi:hypothetical protein
MSNMENDWNALREFTKEISTNSVFIMCDKGNIRIMSSMPTEHTVLAMLLVIAQDEGLLNALHNVCKTEASNSINELIRVIAGAALGVDITPADSRQPTADSEQTSFPTQDKEIDNFNVINLADLRNGKITIH